MRAAAGDYAVAVSNVPECPKQMMPAIFRQRESFVPIAVVIAKTNENSVYIVSRRECRPFVSDDFLFKKNCIAYVSLFKGILDKFFAHIQPEAIIASDQRLNVTPLEAARGKTRHCRLRIRGHVQWPGINPVDPQSEPPAQVGNNYRMQGRRKTPTLAIAQLLAFNHIECRINPASESECESTWKHLFYVRTKPAYAGISGNRLNCLPAEIIVELADKARCFESPVH